MWPLTPVRQVPLNTTDASGRLLPLIYGGAVVPVGAADRKVQAYCFRPCMTKMAGGKAVPPLLPKAYEAKRWQLFRNLLAASPPGTYKVTDFFYFAGPLGNSSGDAAKFDVGTSGPLNLDVIGEVLDVDV
jgi:hypothetical protein|eukprot:COSAG01_NODE_5480_length_4231_cov_10.097484_3_plen_130_part_00